LRTQVVFADVCGEDLDKVAKNVIQTACWNVWQSTGGEEIAEYGYHTLEHHTSLSILLKDPATGRLFESQNNQDAHFKPDSTFLQAEGKRK